MELDVNIILNEYKKELYRLQNENISLRSQVIQLGRDLEDARKEIERLESSAPVQIKEVVNNDLHSMQGDGEK
jgi:hypothetical protein